MREREREIETKVTQFPIPEARMLNYVVLFNITPSRNERLGVIKVERVAREHSTVERVVVAYCATLYITAVGTPRDIKNVHRICGNMVSSYKVLTPRNAHDSSTGVATCSPSIRPIDRLVIDNCNCKS